MRKRKTRTAIRRTMAAVMLCAFLFSTGASVYAEGDVDNIEEATEMQKQEPSAENVSSKEEESTGENSSKSQEETNSSKSEEQQKNTEADPSQTDSAQSNQTNNNPDVQAGENTAGQETQPENKGEETPEAHTEHTWGDPQSNEDGTHTYSCTSEGCTEKKSESCSNFEVRSYEDDNGIKYKEKYCVDCDYVAETWRVTPEIKRVTPDKNGHTGVYTKKTGFTATIVCQDISKSAADNAESEEAKLKEGLEVELKVRELLTNEAASLTPISAEYQDGCITYTWAVPEDDSLEESACYAVEEVVARNTEEDTEISEELDYKVYIADPEKENQKANFIITGQNNFEVNAKYEDDIWYSNGGNSEDKLKVSIQGTAIGADAFRVNKFEEEFENGKTKTIPCANAITEPETGTYPISKFIETIEGIISLPYLDETEYDFKYELPTDVEGKHTYNIEYEVSRKDFDKKLIVNIDNTCPELVSLTYNDETSPVGSEGAESGYYSDKVRVTAVVKENNLENEEELQHLTIQKEGSSDDIYFKQISCEEDADNNKIYTFEAVVDAEGKYHVGGKIIDKAGNATKEFNEPEFVIDNAAPDVVVNFDTSDAKNDKYYSNAKTVTITVTDANFNPDDSAWEPAIDQKLGTAKVEGWQSEGENVYTKKVTFSEDGIYSLSFSCKDKSGHDSVKKETGEFVIDTTKPNISVNYDGSSVKNEIYFNSARKAKITIDDISFSESLVSISKGNDSDINALPGVGSYSNNDYKYETTMNFENDGRYSFKIKCEDLAGNVEEFTSDVFVIDTTAPEIEIAGVEDMSANNGVVEPVINSKDLNLKPEDISVTITGANNGKVLSGQLAGDNKNGYTVKINDIAHEKSADDLYILEAKVTDLAGNTTEKKIKYSVNRFGSVYVLGDGTKKMIDGHYVTRPEDVVITEINVDSLSYKDVSLTFDGKVNNLKEGKGYEISETTNDKGWHSISYTIGKNNFKSDGMYSVTVYSEDRATNKQSNQSKDAEIEFVVDMTAPSVVVSGIESDGVYEEASHDFSVNATDTIGVTEMTVYVDDKKLDSFSSSELNENGGTEIITVPGKDDYQQIEIVCSDIAGNETRLSYNNILVSEKAETLIEEGKIKKTITDDEVAKMGGFTNWPVATAAALAVAVFAVGGVYGYRRLKIKK